MVLKQEIKHSHEHISELSELRTQYELQQLEILQRVAGLDDSEQASRMQLQMLKPQKIESAALG